MYLHVCRHVSACRVKSLSTCPRRLSCSGGHPRPGDRLQCCHFGLVQPWTTRSKVGPMSPSVVQGRPFCGGLEWSKANFGRAGPGPRWDLAWRSANLEKFRLRRSFARGPAPSTPVLEESLDFEAGRGKKEGFFLSSFHLRSSGPMWSNVGPMCLSHAIPNGPMCLKM